MIFQVQIDDPSLRGQYYIKHISTTLATTLFTLPLTVTASSAQPGILVVNTTASLAIPSATITIIGSLSLTQP
jgi:hypothetical protein